MKTKLLSVLIILGLVTNCKSSGPDSLNNPNPVNPNPVETVKVLELPKSDFRGVWLTNVGSEAMKTEANIQKMINNCQKFGINNIYVVVWNKGLTMYPSKVLEEYIGIKQDPIYNNFDPIAKIIQLAHQKEIKVHAWFEFGFSFAYNDPSSTWIQRYPTWLGRDSKGDILMKNNFMWWNALDPEPQNFLLKLIEEVIANYDIDGIQGDDRLPAMPSEGGYDENSQAMYFAEKNTLPPANTKDPVWIQWRADKLSQFAKKIYTRVKELDSKLIVSWAPGIYPWAKNEYLQDWPAWLRGGYADYIIPQLYRYKLEDYKAITDQLIAEFNEEELKKIYAGVLTGLGGGYRIEDQLLLDMINYHRSKGLNGEVFFYYESFNR